MSAPSVVNATIPFPDEEHKDRQEQRSGVEMGRHRTLRAWLGSLRRSLPVRLVGEAVVVLGMAITTAVVLPVVVAEGMHSIRGQASALLTAATAGAAAAVALLCAASSRISAGPDMRLLSYAQGFYALVVMPVTVVDAVPDRDPVIPGAAVAVTALFLVLLALSFVDPGTGWLSRTRWLSGPRVFVGSTVLTVLVIVAAAGLPSHIAGVLDSGLAETVLLTGWGLVACAYITRGLRHRFLLWYRMGFGFILITAGHALLVGGGALEFTALRLLGFLVLVAALSAHTRQLLRRQRASEAAAAERARAEERARSQRHHEVRNALTNLSSVTTLMTPRPEVSAAGGESLAAMIDAELARLRGLIENTDPSGDSTITVVEEVLVRLVTLRRAAGARITLDVPSGLMAHIPTATFGQVVTNLLTNCARHAPGARIHVGAYPEEDGCVVEVTDAGPGLGTDMGAAPSSGDGLGLALSAQLVEAAGGTLELHPATRFSSGTTVLLHLPCAPGARCHYPVAPHQGRAVP